MPKTTQIVKIVEEPKVDFYISCTAENPDITLKVGDEISCPHCHKKSPVTRRVNIKAFDVIEQKFIDISLPEKAARAAFSQAYNSLLNRIVRAWNVKGFWAKVKALRKTEILSLPSPSETVWTIVRTDDKIEVTADLETK
jgi:hypothetical protein